MPFRKWFFPYGKKVYRLKKKTTSATPITKRKSKIGTMKFTKILSFVVRAINIIAAGKDGFFYKMYNIHKRTWIVIMRYFRSSYYAIIRNYSGEINYVNCKVNERFSNLFILLLSGCWRNLFEYNHVKRCIMHFV